VSDRDSVPSTKKVNSYLPCGRHILTLLYSAGYLIALLLLLEVAARKGFLNKISTRESLGIYPTPMGQNFDIKWYGLQDYVARNGGVDIILIGSSVVNTGINPDIVAETYYQLTGTRLRIYNFSVESMDIVPNSVYAKILVQKYHPALLMFGMVPRDYLVSDNVGVNQQFMLSPWIEFKSGEWNLAGYLIDHSAMLDHYLPYRNWMRSDFPDTLYTNDHRVSATSSSGYEPDNYVWTNFDQPPDPNSPDEQDAFAKYRDFSIDPARLDCLQSILNLQKTGNTRVIAMEMPLDPTFYDYMGGFSVYQNYQYEIASAVAASGGLFFPSNGTPQIPANGRSDRGHLNKYGAPVFSTYLGTKLANLTLYGGMQFTNTGQGGH
jgi:hypothetical protein